MGIIIVHGEGGCRRAGNSGLIPPQGIGIEQVVRWILSLLTETGRSFLFVYKMSALSSSLQG
jgi:hypothetical protein